MTTADLSAYLLGRTIDRALELESLPRWDWDASYDAERVQALLLEHGISWLPQNSFAPATRVPYSPLSSG